MGGGVSPDPQWMPDAAVVLGMPGAATTGRECASVRLSPKSAAAPTVPTLPNRPLYAEGECAQPRIQGGGPVARRQSMVLQITPLRACNLRCTHCFITNEHKAGKARMDPRLFQWSLDMGLQFSKHFDLYDVEFVLMGGELHLLPLDHLAFMGQHSMDRGMAHLRAALSDDSASNLRSYSYNFITNLIHTPQPVLDLYARLWDDHMEDLARDPLPPGADFDFLLATSWEPDTNRFASPKVYDRWIKTIEWLRARGVRVGVALTGTRGTTECDPKALLDWIVRDLGCYAMYDHFAPYGAGVQAADQLLPDYDRMCRFLGDLMLYGEQLSQELGIDGLVAPGIGGTRPLEQLNSRLAAVLAIDYDGAVVMDSESSADLQYTGDHGLYIQQGSQEEVMADLLRMGRRRLNADFSRLMATPCADCRHLRRCQGGYIHWADVFPFDGADQCPGLKPMLDRLYPDTSARRAQDGDDARPAALG